MENKRFNIRVYGIWIRDGRLLVCDEQVKGGRLVKFPGGGLEYGEGTADCLKREWQEEFGVDINVLEHFYTTDYFQPSFFDESQVISIYYFVRPADPAAELIPLEEADRILWIPGPEIVPELFTLPIDRKVGGMLQVRWQERAGLL